MKAGEFDQAFDIGADISDALELETATRGAKAPPFHTQSSDSKIQSATLPSADDFGSNTSDSVASVGDGIEVEAQHEDAAQASESMEALSESDTIIIPPPPEAITSASEVPNSDEPDNLTDDTHEKPPAHMAAQETIVAVEADSTTILTDDSHSQITPQQRHKPMVDHADLEAVMPKGMLVDFPDWMIESIDQEAIRLGVSSDAIIKIWIAERLEQRAVAAR